LTTREILRLIIVQSEDSVRPANRKAEMAASGTVSKKSTTEARRHRERKLAKNLTRLPELPKSFTEQLLPCFGAFANGIPMCMAEAGTHLKISFFVSKMPAQSRTFPALAAPGISELARAWRKDKNGFEKAVSWLAGAAIAQASTASRAC
jgi:hypothetical protein